MMPRRTGIALAILLPLAYWRLSAGEISAAQQVIALLYLALFAAIAAIDLQRQRIPTALIIALAALGFLYALFAAQPVPALLSAAAGGLFCGFAFCLAYWGGKLYQRHLERAGGNQRIANALGLGDVYLMAAGGMIAGLPNALAALLLALLLGGLGSLGWRLHLRARGREYAPFTALPYAPYIFAGSAVTLLFPAETERVLWSILG